MVGECAQDGDGLRSRHDSRVNSMALVREGELQLGYGVKED